MKFISKFFFYSLPGIGSYTIFLILTSPFYLSMLYLIGLFIITPMILSFFLRSHDSEIYNDDIDEIKEEFKLINEERRMRELQTLKNEDKPRTFIKRRKT